MSKPPYCRNTLFSGKLPSNWDTSSSQMLSSFSWWLELGGKDGEVCPVPVPT